LECSKEDTDQDTTRLLAISVNADWDGGVFSLEKRKRSFRGFDELFHLKNSMLKRAMGELVNR